MRNVDEPNMAAGIKQGFARIAIARQNMVDARALRWETLQRFKSFAKAKLSEFLASTDPVSGQRYADINAGGDKARGEAAMVLNLFEGTRLRLTVDQSAHFGFEVHPLELFADVARIVDIVVPADLSKAELVYESSERPGTRRTLDLGETIVQMIEHAAGVVERELGDAVSALATPPAPPPAPKPVFSFSAG